MISAEREGPLMQTLIDLFLHLIQVVLHLDLYLNEWVTYFGPSIYAVLFLVIFAETGFVVTPLLPGDSLLFALGALTAVTQAYLDITILLIVPPPYLVMPRTIRSVDRSARASLMARVVFLSWSISRKLKASMRSMVARLSLSRASLRFSVPLRPS